MTKWQKDKMTWWKMTRWKNNQIKKLLEDKMTKWPTGSITLLKSYQVTKLPKGRTTKNNMTKRQICQNDQMK